VEVILSEARATAWKYASAVLAVLAVAAVVLALFFYGSARTSDLRAERAEPSAIRHARRYCNCNRRRRGTMPPQLPLTRRVRAWLSRWCNTTTEPNE